MLAIGWQHHSLFRNLPPFINLLIGWGKIKHPGSSYHILQQAMMPPIDNNKCKQKISQAGGTLLKLT